MSAVLKKEGCDVRLVFLPRYFTDKYEDRMLDEFIKISKASDLIGISVMTNFFDNVLQITRRIKKDLDIPVVWGGIHPTVRPEECLDYADMVCMGEGEDVMIGLTERIRQRRTCHDVEGVWAKHDGKVIKNRIRPLIQDLDSLPFPDYDYETHYILDGGSIHKMDKSLLRKYSYGTYMTMPSRGCPFGCSYCCNNTLNNMYSGQKPVRKRSVDNLIEELARVKNTLPVMERIKFDDDAFFYTYTMEEIRDFCEKYKRKVSLPLQVTGVTPSTINREKLSLLVDAGLTTVRLGIQAGSERTKRLYKRNYPNQQVEKAAGIINEFSDRIEVPQYDIILDNPWETDEDLTETLMFLTKLSAPYRLGFFSLTFYPGTELYDRAKREGIIADDLNDVYRKHYHGCGKNYLNKLFFLMNRYAAGGGRISPGVMRLLTDKRLRKLRVSHVLYIAVMIGSVPLKVKWLKYLLCEGLKEIRRGNWSRIAWYVKTIFRKG